MIIYKVKNLINGKIYIGQTIRTLDQRKKDHFKHIRAGSNVYFHKALRKYGDNNFEWKIIDKAENIEELNDLEIRYIKEYNSFIDYDDSNGYNMTEGGMNSRPSEITKQILREYALEQFKHGHPNKGKTLEEIHGKDKANEIKKKLRNANLGKSLSRDTKIKIKKSNLGKSVTDKFREKMRDIVTGRKHNQETRDKISKSLIGNKRHLGHTHSKATREQISKSRRDQPAHNRMKVCQINKEGNVIKIWDTITEAQQTLNIYNISKAINGQQNTAGGFRWEKLIYE